MENPKFRLSGRHAEVDTRSGDVAERPFCAAGWSVRAARTRCLSRRRRLQVKHKVAIRFANGCAFATRRMAAQRTLILNHAQNGLTMTANRMAALGFDELIC